jgi:hypothetical protein
VPGVPGAAAVTDIEVECDPSPDGWRCQVRVTEGGRTTTFDVTTRDPTIVLPADGETGSLEGDVERLVSETFVFLLEREPVSSILPRFDLTVVERYFPDYPTEIRRRLGA